MKLGTGAIAVSLVLMVAAQWGSADTLEIDDGSRVVGTITSIADGKVAIDTEFAGTLSIDQAKVKNYTWDSTLNVKFESGNTLSGTATQQDGKLVVQTPDGIMTVDNSKVVAAWDESGRDPTLPPLPKEREWKYELSVDIGGKTGNTEKLSTGVGVRATMDTGKDKLMFYGRSSYSRENGVRTVDDRVGGVDYENFFSKDHSWYARAEMGTDRINKLNLRNTAAVGYGYYFLNRPDEHVLRGRLGALYLHESYEDREDTSAPGVDVGLHHMIMLQDWGKLVTDITYTPSLEYGNDYRIYHESALDIPLARSEAWKLRLSVANDYTALPPEDTERLDTTYAAKLVLGF